MFVSKYDLNMFKRRKVDAEQHWHVCVRVHVCVMVYAVSEWLHCSAHCSQEEPDGYCQHAGGTRCSNQCTIQGQLLL